MVHEGQESVENAENMNAEHEQALRRMGGSHMSKFEGWLRMRLLRKRPFRVLSLFLTHFQVFDKHFEQAGTSTSTSGQRENISFRTWERNLV